MRPSAIQILILVVILILLFGAQRLPDLARSVGQSLRILKTEVKEPGDEADDAVRRDSAAARTPSGRDPDRSPQG